MSLLELYMIHALKVGLPSVRLCRAEMIEIFFRSFRNREHRLTDAAYHQQLLPEQTKTVPLGEVGLSRKDQLPLFEAIN